MNHSPHHLAFETDLKAFLDGELPFLRRFEVRRHLRNCPLCREEIRIMQTIETELKEETAPLGADLRAKILNQVPGEAPKAAPQMPLRTRAQLGFGVANAAVLAALLFYPAYQGFREYERGMNMAGRSATQPNLNQIGLGGKQYIQDYDERISGASSAASSAAPSNAPIAGTVGIDGAARATDVLRGAKRRGLSNEVFSDGRVKYQNQIDASDARSSGNSSQALAGDGNGIYLENRAVHKEGSLTVSLDNAERGGDAVEQIVKNAGGFVASNSLSTGAGEIRSATLDCRVPVEKFEFVTQKVGALGTVRAKTINGEDITARIAAASARKSTLSREFSVASAQLRQKEKSAKKRDAQSLYYARLEVRNLRVQAAQSRAALETLRRFSSLASLYVTVQDKAKDKIAPIAGTNGELGQTARAAWNSFLVSARLPFQLLIWILVYAPLWLPALIIWKKWGRKWINAA